MRGRRPLRPRPDRRERPPEPHDEPPSAGIKHLATIPDRARITVVARGALGATPRTGALRQLAAIRRRVDATAGHSRRGISPACEERLEGLLSSRSRMIEQLTLGGS